MSNSSLATYTKISPHKNSPRNHAIDRITIHCYVGQVTAKQGCDYFAKPNLDASCNYVVGKDGSIGLCRVSCSVSYFFAPTKEAASFFGRRLLSFETGDSDKFSCQPWFINR